MKKFILEEAREKYKNNRDVISLFSGAMGLDIGLGKAGLSNSFCKEDGAIDWEKLVEFNSGD